MCTPARSCNINEDNGITLAHTIAHEMGHKLVLSTSITYLYILSTSINISPNNQYKFWKNIFNLEYENLHTDYSVIICALDTASKVVFVWYVVSFGMFHDSAKSGCVSRRGHTLHVMTPTFEADSLHIAWSPCSRRDITHFLEYVSTFCSSRQLSFLLMFPVTVYFIIK